MVLDILLKLFKGQWGTLLASLVKAVADGKLGAVPSKLYWAVAGVKAFVGVLLGAAYLVLTHWPGVCPPCAGWAHGLAVASVTLLAIGWTDQVIREEPPKQS